MSHFVLLAACGIAVLLFPRAAKRVGTGIFAFFCVLFAIPAGYALLVILGLAGLALLATLLSLGVAILVILFGDGPLRDSALHAAPITAALVPLVSLPLILFSAAVFFLVTRMIKRHRAERGRISGPVVIDVRCNGQRS